jgi:hypothetical protein
MTLYLVPADIFELIIIDEGEEEDTFFLRLISDFLLRPPSARTVTTLAIKQPMVFGPVSFFDTSSLTVLNFQPFPIDFDEDISRWDVSNVTMMCNLFRQCRFFNQPLENWNVSKVQSMASMFLGAQRFNQPLERWNVSKVFHMQQMFSSAFTFNQPLEKWNVSNVINMEAMFSNTQAFNQPIASWDVSKVKKMEYMFSDARSFNQSVVDWKFHNEVEVNSMFCLATLYKRYYAQEHLSVRFPHTMFTVNHVFLT